MSSMLSPRALGDRDHFGTLTDEFGRPDQNPVLEPPLSWMPRVDISETDRQFTFKMDLAGFEPDDIEVDVCGDELLISGKREQNHNQLEHGELIRSERHFGTFQRCFNLHCAVKTNEIDAKFKNGILTLTIPKLEGQDFMKIPVHE